MKRTIKFRDHAAESAYSIAQNAIENGQADQLNASCDADRWSPDALKRLHSAVAYIALADHAMSNNDLHEASLLYHFAGHGFRGLGMQAKAGQVYRLSYETGEQAAAFVDQTKPDKAKSMRAFNSRSIRRAAREFRACGLEQDHIEALRLVGDHELANAERQQRWPEVITRRLWRRILDDSLSWAHAIVVLSIGLILVGLWPSSWAAGALTIGVLSMIVTAIRRL